MTIQLSHEQARHLPARDRKPGGKALVMGCQG